MDGLQDIVAQLLYIVADFPHLAFLTIAFMQLHSSLSKFASASSPATSLIIF